MGHRRRASRRAAEGDRARAERDHADRTAGSDVETARADRARREAADCACDRAARCEAGRASDGTDDRAHRCEANCAGTADREATIAARLAEGYRGASTGEAATNSGRGSDRSVVAVVGRRSGSAAKPASATPPVVLPSTTAPREAGADPPRGAHNEAVDEPGIISSVIGG